jgi:hypothetical protein
LIIFCIDLNSFQVYGVLSVIIHNQCSDFELTSLECFSHNVIWHIPPDQKVDANTMTSGSFGVSAAVFTSALIYKLQKKSHNSNNQSNADNTEDALTNIQLLVIWGLNDRDFYLDTVLIKHSNTITWDKDKLWELYSTRRHPQTDELTFEDTWLLDDATVLMTVLTFEEENSVFKITISKGIRIDDSIELLCIS